MKAVAIKQVVVKLQIKELIVLLSVSIVLPFLIHLFPTIGEVPAGARLLPMFYAPLIAAIFLDVHIAVIVGLFSPILNFLFRQHPDPQRLFLITFQLVVFSVMVSIVQKKWKNFWGTALISYCGAVVAAVFMTVLSLPVLPEAEAIISAALLGLPGIAVITLLNIVLLHYKKERSR